MNLYSHADWIRFREEVIKLDGGKCVRCDRSRRDGIVLQVHHKSYAPGQKPWEYGHTECETLCKGCHAEEHGIIMPQSGWELIGTDDLGDLVGNCEHCGTDLRYTYAIIHPTWGAMMVGTVCCDHLTGTVDASEFHDKYVKDRERRARFLSSSRWRILSDREWAIKQSGIEVHILKNADQFQIYMNSIAGKQLYSSLAEAKLKAFDTIESGEAAKFIQKWLARRTAARRDWHLAHNQRRSLVTQRRKRARL